MRKVLLAVGFLVIALSPVVRAQHGTAPADYYPVGYSGDTWTGIVASASDETREIKLTYTNKDKTETFAGVLKDGYKIKMKDGSMRELKPSSIPVGDRVKVFYMADTRKVDGKKVKVYEIFKLLEIHDDK
jgi:hypothetical protein